MAKASAAGTAFRPFSIDLLMDSSAINGLKIKLESVATLENNLYVGTSDGQVCHFSIEKKQTGAKPELKFLSKNNVGVAKKPVEQLVVAVSPRKLLAVCDSTLVILQLGGPQNLKPVANLGNIKGAFGVGVDLKDSIHCELCLIKKRSIARYELTERLVSDVEIDVSDQALCVCCYGKKACYANSTEYRILDTDTKDEVSLVPYDTESDSKPKAVPVVPLIRMIHDGEFLLSMTSARKTGLGVFVSQNGTAVRGTLQWSSYPIVLGFRFPYVVGVLKSTIEIHSLVDLKLQQTLELLGNDEPRALCEGRGRSIYLITRQSILLLTVQSVDVQVESLLRSHRVSDAIALAEYSLSAEDKLDASKKTQLLSNIHSRAAFTLIREGAFAEAVEHLLKGEVDPRLMIALFTSISTSIFGSATLQTLRQSLRELLSFESITDLADSIAAANERSVTPQTAGLRSPSAVVQTATDALRVYLTTIRTFPLVTNDNALKEEVDTCLLKIYADKNDPALYSFLQQPNSCLLEEAEDTLKVLQKHYALALLYKHHNLHDKASSIWVRLITKELTTDEDYGSLSDLVDYMSSIPDARLIWKHADTILQINPIIGAKIFTGTRTTSFVSADVLRLLSKYGDAASSVYLEHLVNDLNSQVEQHHTELALIYFHRVQAAQKQQVDPATFKRASLYAELSKIKDLEEAFSQRSDKSVSFEEFIAQSTDDLSTYRAILLRFLKNSKYYRVPLLLDSLQDSGLQAELAVLYSRIGQHEKALEILVFQMQDFTGAENYCRQPLIENSTDFEARELSKDLYLTLLKVYLSAPSSSNLVQPVTHLLDNHMTELDAVKVLNILPGSWSLGVLDKFLTRAIRRNFHERQETRIVRALLRGEGVQVRSELYQLRSGASVITNKTICPVCGRAIDDAVFARYPNGTIVHLQCCTDPHVDPKSGTDFRTNSAS